MGVSDRDYMKKRPSREFNQDRSFALLPSGNHLCLHLIVIVHWIVVFANLGAIIVLPILCLTGDVPWYIVFPLMTWLSVSACTRVDCPFTRYENKLRRKLGKPPIDAFIKHYFYVPFKRFKRRIKL